MDIYGILQRTKELFQFPVLNSRLSIYLHLRMELSVVGIQGVRQEWPHVGSEEPGASVPAELSWTNDSQAHSSSVYNVWIMISLPNCVIVKIRGEMNTHTRTTQMFVEIRIAGHNIQFDVSSPNDRGPTPCLGWPLGWSVLTALCYSPGAGGAPGAALKAAPTGSG